MSEEPISPEAMDDLVQDALDAPRRGDIFHQDFAYGFEVLAVTSEKVSWRSFTAVATLDLGTVSRAEWSLRFREPTVLGEPVRHTMRLHSRGTIGVDG